MTLPRKIARGALSSLLTLSLITGAAGASYGSGTVNGSSVRLREGPSTGSAVLTKLSKGTQVDVLEAAVDGWYKISVNGKTGYTSADYIDVTVAVEDGAVPAAAGPEAEDGTLYALVDADLLNVRSGAGTEFDKVGGLNRNSLITVLSQADGWAQIRYGDLVGYVSAEYLTFGTKEELTAQSGALGARMVEIARKYLGTRYVYGGTSPSGFDCSGFTRYVAGQAGISLPHSATDQWNLGYPRVSKSELQPGDLVFFSDAALSSRTMSHVGMYVGGGNFIHSSSSRNGGVIISSLSASYYSSHYGGACRLG